MIDPINAPHFTAAHRNALALSAEEDRRAKRDELMQREEARLAALAVFEARIGKYDRMLDGLSYRDHDEQVIAGTDGRLRGWRAFVHRRGEGTGGQTWIPQSGD